MSGLGGVRLLALFPIIAGYAVLSACASGPPPEDVFYTLAPVTTPPASASPLTGTILVNRLATRGFTGGRRIVFRDEKQPLQIQRYHYLYWADAPAVMIQDQLAQGLRDAAIADYVITPAERARADWIGSGNLLRMEHHPDARPPAVAVEVELGIVSAACRDSVFLKRYSVHQAAQNKQIDQAIPAFERALRRLIGQFLKDARGVLDQHPKTDPPTCR